MMPITHLTQTAPYQDGNTRTDSRMEPRVIAFDVMVTAPSLEDIQAAIKSLAALLNPLEGTGHLVFTYEDGSEYTIHAIGNNTPMVFPQVRGANHQLINLAFICHDPFWYGSPPHIAYLEASSNAFFPFDVSANWLGANGDTQTLNNAGNVDTPVTIVISGEIVNPCLWNKTTDQSLNITVTMTATETFTITTGFGNKTATLLHDDGSSENGFKYINPDSVFWQLTQGDNIVALSDDTIGAATFVSIEWEDRYSGI